MYVTTIKHVPPTPRDPHQVPISLEWQIIGIIIGAIIGVYFYYKKLKWK